MWSADSNDPFDDLVEAAALDRLLTAVSLVDLSDPSSLGDWRVVTAPDVVDGEEGSEVVLESPVADRDLIIDLRETTLLTAKGCRTLHELHEIQLRSGHVLALKGATGIVRQVIDITGLDRVVLLIPAA